MKRLLLLLPMLLCLLATQAAQCQSMDEIKNAPYLMQVMVSGAVTYLEPTECYIESVDRITGIRVQANMAGIQIGDVVTVTGTFSYVNGERVIANASVYLQDKRVEILPFGMNNLTIAGSLSSFPLDVWDYLRNSQTGEYYWEHARGLCNSGLLIKAWGTVNAVYDSGVTGAHWFYVDDESSVVSDYGDIGVLVYSDADVKEGDFVVVTGISNVEPSFDDPNRLIRVIRTRDNSDVQTARKFKPDYPFSDEFNKPTLDSRWVVDWTGGTANNDPNAISITPDGWLKLRQASYIWPYTQESPRIFQCFSGDWDVEIKVRSEFSTSAQYPQYFYINLCDDFVYNEARIEFNPYEQPAKRVRLSSGHNPVYYPMISDICYFRFRARAGKVYFSARCENAEYSDELVFTASYPAIVMYSTASVTSYVDYFRFTRVSE